MAKVYPDSLLSAYTYDPNTGIFVHNKKLGVKSGTISGCDNGNGYLRITHKKNTYYAHRLAWFFVHGEVPQNQIDHINGDKQDNRICNLRLATSEQNAWNKHSVKGVSWHQKARKWQSHFKHKYLGLFEKFEDARRAYEYEKQSSNPFVEAV